MTDRNKRILVSVGILAIELALIFVVGVVCTSISGDWGSVVGFAVLLLAIRFVFPTPLASAPSKYEITKQGVFFNGKKTFPLGKKHRFKVNQSRNFVSVRERKGEVLKLYTTETEKVMKILDKIIASN